MCVCDAKMFVTMHSLVATPTTPGTKRPRDEDDRSGGRSKSDPSTAPDPEEPESFNEKDVSGLMGEEFVPPEDDNVIILDKCKNG